MESRFNMGEMFPKAYAALLRLNEAVSKSSLDASLRDLINIRASQINGCAFCIHMHTKEAREKGESEQRIYALNAWKESPFFSDREKAVLALTEAITLISEEQVPDAVYHEVEKYFHQGEIAQLIMAIITINALNRSAISTGLLPEME